MKKLFIFILSIELLNSNTHAQDLHQKISINGTEREYLIHLPPNYQSSTKIPIIFAFHGSGGNYEMTVRHFGLNPLADQNGFIVVYPNAINKNWMMHWQNRPSEKIDNDDVDLNFISTLLDKLIADYKADSKRVFCTGFSRGAVFSYYLAWKLSDRISAIAPVCGSIPKAVVRIYSFAHPISVLMINGTEDPLINYDGGFGKNDPRIPNIQTPNMLGTEDLVKQIAIMDNCNDNPIISNLPDNDPKDGCTATQYDYNCTNTKITFIKITNGGHTWPGGYQYLPKDIIGNKCNDFSASEKIIDFFKSVHFQ